MNGKVKDQYQLAYRLMRMESTGRIDRETARRLYAMLPVKAFFTANKSDAARHRTFTGRLS